MADNKFLTHKMIARWAAKELKEELGFFSSVNTQPTEEFGNQVRGYKEGSSVTIRVPAVPVTYEGALLAGGKTVKGFKEGEVLLKIEEQWGREHTPIQFGTFEQTMDITDYGNRYVKPAMQALGSKVMAKVLARLTPMVPNVVGTAGTVPNTRRTYGEARAVLNQHLAPMTDRSIQFTSEANLELAEANAPLFHTGNEIQKEFSKGAVGTFAGFDFYECQALYTHINGAGAGYTVDTAGQTGDMLKVTAGTGNLTKGTVFTIAGVYDVHPLTGYPLGRLRQFVVVDDYAGGAGSVHIYPEISVSSQDAATANIGTVSASPAASAPITIIGGAGAVMPQNIAYHKDAIALAMPPLEIPMNGSGSHATIENLSVRSAGGWDPVTDINSARLDTIFGCALVRPDHVVRITE